MQRHGKYVGALPHLQGKTALLNPGASPDLILAQFDDVKLTLSGLPAEEASLGGRFEDPSADLLGYGWHEFHAEEFE